MSDLWNRYQSALKDTENEHDCSALDFCDACSLLDGLIRQMRKVGYRECLECGAFIPPGIDDDYCSRACLLT
jgi:hypothetical protein